jgi:galactokinase/mevalonate kinase-like predicted kinase
MKIIAEAPVRIDFAGAWTDVPMFYETFGGATLNAAIKKYVHGELLSGSHRESKDGMRRCTMKPTSPGVPALGALPR